MESSLIEKGKDRGYLLSDEVIAAFPHAEDDVESLDEFYHSLYENGIEVVDHAPRNGAVDLRSRIGAQRTSSGPRSTNPVTDHRQAADDALAAGVSDSVRLYLQEIGETDLLNMQEEVWLAKRMERGLIAEERLKNGDYAERFRAVRTQR
jgi:RNA polymerase primary sigma factor